MSVGLSLCSQVESETAELMEMVSRSQQQLNATVEQYEHEVAMLRQV
jgi:hypothetical protein